MLHLFLRRMNKIKTTESMFFSLKLDLNIILIVGEYVLTVDLNHFLQSLQPGCIHQGIYQSSQPLICVVLLKLT